MLRSVGCALLICAIASGARADELIILRSGVNADLDGRSASPPPDSSGEGSSRGFVADTRGIGSPCQDVADCGPITDIMRLGCNHWICVNSACDIESDCTELEICSEAACLQVVYFEENITYLGGPDTGPFAAPFQPADFDAARAGPSATIPTRLSQDCIGNLLEDPEARPVSTGSGFLELPYTTALYALDFEVTSPTIEAASINLYIRPDDELGGGPNPGLFLNGMPLSGDTTGGSCDQIVPRNVYRKDIAPLLVPGTNTLYINITRTDASAVSGMQFFAEIRVDSDGPEIIYVDDDADDGGNGDSWETAYNDLQLALDEAAASLDPNREIWVAEGFYPPSATTDAADPRSAVFELLNDVPIYGGFEGNESNRSDRDPSVFESVLTADLSLNDFADYTHPTWNENAYHILRTNYLTLRALVDGVVIEHGNANGTSAGQKEGAAVYMSNRGILTLVDCTIRDHFTQNGGTVSMLSFSQLEMTGCTVERTQNGPSGGAVLGELWTEVVLTDCRFHDNKSGNGAGIALSRGGSLRAERTFFERNEALGSGGAIYAFGSDTTNTEDAGIDVTLIDCDFADNDGRVGDGGAIYYHIKGTDNQGAFSVQGSTFTQNTADENGGAIYASAEGTSGISVEVRDSQFTLNSVRETSAGAVRVFNADPLTFEDCSFDQNATQFGGTAVVVWNNDPTFRRCAFRDNTGPFGSGAINGAFLDSILVEGCSFVGNTTRSGAAMSLSGSSSGLPTAEILDSTFLGNRATSLSAGAISLFEFETDMVNCLLAGNESGADGGAVTVVNSALTMINTTSVGNTAAALGGGIYGENSLITVRNSILRDNEDSTGSSLDAQASGDAVTLVDIEYSNVTDIVGGAGNLDQSPAFRDADGSDDILGTEDDDFRLAPGSPCIDAADNSAVLAGTTTDLDDNPRFHDDTGTADTGAGTPPIVDMGCYEFQGRTTTTYYVDDSAPDGGDGESWASPFDRIDDALALAGEGDRILVGQGTYKPAPAVRGDPRQATFALVSGVSLVGGFAGYGAADPGTRNVDAFESTLSGDRGTPGDASDNCYHVVDASGVSADTLLDGFTITGGNGNGSTSTTNRGAGLYNNGGDLLVRDCTFFLNESSFNGGAVYNTQCQPAYIDCAFIRNTSGSGGGGMINFSEADTTIVNGRFHGNTAVIGGGMYNQAGSDATIVNSEFAGNVSSGRGGGISNHFASAIIINSTIAGNLAESFGGGIACNQDSFSLFNSIVWGNLDLADGTETDQIWISGGSVNASHSCIQDWAAPGVDGNTDAAPRFTRMPDDGGDGWGHANDDYGNLHVLAGSCAIDSGDNALSPADAFDLDADDDTLEPLPFDLGHTARFVDHAATPDVGAGAPPIIDMGAYEYVAADCNYDGSVTLVDLVDLVACLDGPADAALGECACFDLAGPDAVDLGDVAAFQLLFEAPE